MPLMDSTERTEKNKNKNERPKTLHMLWMCSVLGPRCSIGANGILDDYYFMFLRIRGNHRNRTNSIGGARSVQFLRITEILINCFNYGDGDIYLWAKPATQWDVSTGACGVFTTFACPCTAICVIAWEMKNVNIFSKFWRIPTVRVHREPHVKLRLHHCVICSFNDTTTAACVVCEFSSGANCKCVELKNKFFEEMIQFTCCNWAAPSS